MKIYFILNKLLTIFKKFKLFNANNLFISFVLCEFNIILH